MKIVEIEYKSGSFGHGQISNNHHDYWSGKNDGNIYLSTLKDDCIIAIIKTETYWLYIYNASGKFAIKITTGDKNILPVTVINVNRTYINTISPEALVKAAEEELKYWELARRPLSKLALCRQSYGLTLEELAKASAIDKTTIHRFESGERDIKQARYETVRKIADALQRDISEII